MPGLKGIFILFCDSFWGEKRRGRMCFTLFLLDPLIGWNQLCFHRMKKEFDEEASVLHSVSLLPKNDTKTEHTTHSRIVDSIQNKRS